MEPHEVAPQAGTQATTDVFDALGTARAMRWLKPDPVPAELVEQVLWGATRASNPKNAQPWDFVVVQDQSTRARIGELVSTITPSTPPTSELDPVMRRSIEGGMNLVANFAAAPVIIFVCGKDLPTNRVLKVNHAYSAVYAAAQNLLVAARALGLGTTFTTFHDRNEPAIRELLGIPGDRFLAVTMPLGWPARKFGPLERKPLSDVVHHDHW